MKNTYKYPHTDKMNLKEWKKFANNFNLWFANTNFYGVKFSSIKEFLLHYSKDDFGTIIVEAFSWEKTPEGYDYWKKISHR